MSTFRSLLVLCALGAACQREAAAPVVTEAGGEGRGGKGGGRESGNGAKRFNDTGVYLDGKPIGVLAFGELPVGLEPTWIQDRVSAPERYGDGTPGWRLVPQRRYRFNDYLRAIGVDIAKVKEMHVYGPKKSEVVIASGEDLRGPSADQFMFRFGDELSGKPLPVVPENFGNGRTPDKITGVTIYIEKKPPTLVRNLGMTLDGELVQGIPYAGEPVRGGIRVYYDDKLVAVLKRRLVDGAAVEIKDGRANVLAILASKGVDTQHIADAWLVRGGRRVERVATSALQTAGFGAEPHTNGKLFIDGVATPLDAITLHSREVKPEQLHPLTAEESI